MTTGLSEFDIGTWKQTGNKIVLSAKAKGAEPMELTVSKDGNKLVPKDIGVPTWTRDKKADK